MSSASALLLAGLALVQDASRASEADGWRRVAPGLELVFPADHGAHPEFHSEWWYLTGQVEDADGRRFGLEFTIFRSGLDPRPPAPGDSPLRARQALAGHLAVCDVASGRTILAQRLRRTGTPLARASTEDLELVLEDWSLARAEGDRLTLDARDPATGIGLALELVPEKPLVLHGERGRSVKGRDPANASAYVSWTRLATRGSLTVDGDARDVHGTAWFDHEFGSSVLERGTVGWDWFGLELDDGRELMLFVLRGAPGEAARSGGGTWVERDGSAHALAADAFRIEPRASWTSPRSGATYPAAWRVELPGQGLELELVPLVPDAEIDARSSTGVVYWEGPVEVRGPVRGRGYAELTGYAASMRGRF